MIGSDISEKIQSSTLTDELVENSTDYTSGTQLKDKLSLLPLTMRAMLGNSAFFSKRQNTRKYRKCVMALKEIRQFNCCDYCGVNAENMYITNIDGNYQNNHLENFALSCCYCSYVQLLDFYYFSPLPDQYIVYLPDITQTKLNCYYNEWQKELKNKENILEIKEAIAELVDYRQYLDQIIGVKTEYRDVLGFFAQTGGCDDENVRLKLRWVPSFTMLKSINTLPFLPFSSS